MDRSTHAARRADLRRRVDGGAILFMGLIDAPRNYPANPYPFRQDSHFLYYVGTNLAGMALLLTPDGRSTLYGPPEHPDDLVWHGPHPVLSDHAEATAADASGDIAGLADMLAELQKREIPVHYLPPYRAETILQLSGLLGVSCDEVAAGASEELVRAVVVMRSTKTDAEVEEIEAALEVTAEAYAVAMKMTKPGLVEAQVTGAMQGVALSHDRAQSFLPITSVRGEVLHNNHYANTVAEGDLLVMDSGAESPRFYASDITRTIPVSGRFTPEQKAVYQIVLDAQLAAIAVAKPGVSNRELHFVAARTITAGLKELGLMKGDVDAAVEAGAHALFYPHGIGHMLGLDVHDMEDLGDAVGYPEGEPRSTQFGLAFLRLAKTLEPGFVITVEPGIYFVPALIERWSFEKRHTAFINYEAVERYRNFGGIRIEDDLLITEEGHRVLGPPIPKTIKDVEAAMA